MDDDPLREAHVATLDALEEGDASRAVAHAEWTVARARALELEDDVPHTLFVLSRALQLAGRADEARAVLDEALAGFEATEQPVDAAWAALHLASLAPPERERAVLGRAVEVARRSGDDRVLGNALLSEGCWHAARDRYLPARRAFERAIAHLARGGDDDDAAEGLAHLACLHVRAFALDEAEARAGELLERATTDEQRMIAHEARGLARSRKHRHAGARADLLARARLLRRSGQRARAVVEYARAVLSQVLVLLHGLRLVSREPLRHARAELRENLIALGAYSVLAFVWSLLWILVAGLALRVHEALVALVKLIAFAPLLALLTVLPIDVWVAVRDARQRAQDREASAPPRSG